MDFEQYDASVFDWYYTMPNSNDDNNGICWNMSFDANGGLSNYNPMAGHANGESIRPYTILSVPIYIY